MNNQYFKVDKLTNKQIRFKDLIVYIVLMGLTFLLVGVIVLLTQINKVDPDPIFIWSVIGVTVGIVGIILLFYIVLTKTQNGIKHYEKLYIKIKYLLLVRNNTIKYNDTTYTNQIKNIESEFSMDFNEAIHIKSGTDNYQALLKLDDSKGKSEEYQAILANLKDISEEMVKSTLDMTILTVYEPVNWELDIKIAEARWKKLMKPNLVNYLLDNVNHQFNHWKANPIFLNLQNIKNQSTIDYSNMEYMFSDTVVKNDNNIGNKSLADLDDNFQKMINENSDVNKKDKIKEKISAKVVHPNYYNLVEVERYILFQSLREKTLIENVDIFRNKIQTRGITGMWVNQQQINSIIKEAVLFTPNDERIYEIEEQKDFVIRRSAKNVKNGEIHIDRYTRVLSLNIDVKSSNYLKDFWINHYLTSFNNSSIRFIPNIKYLSELTSRDAFLQITSAMNHKLDKLNKNVNISNEDEIHKLYAQRNEIIELRNKKENIAQVEGVFVLNVDSYEVDYELSKQSDEFKKKYNAKDVASILLDKLENEIIKNTHDDGVIINNHRYAQLNTQKQISNLKFHNLSGIYTDSLTMMCGNPFLDSFEKHDVDGAILGVDISENSPIAINHGDFQKGGGKVSITNTLLDKPVLFGKYNSGNILLSGPMGSGKSSLSKKIILTYYGKGYKIIYYDPENESTNEFNLETQVPHSDFKMVSFDYNDRERFQPVSPIIPQGGIPHQEEYNRLLNNIADKPTPELFARSQNLLEQMTISVQNDVKSQLGEFFQILFKTTVEEVQQNDFLNSIYSIVDNYYTTERITTIMETQKWPTISNLLEIFKNNFYKQHFDTEIKSDTTFTRKSNEEKVMIKIREIYGSEVNLMFSRFKTNGDLYRYFNTDSFIDFKRYNFINFSIKHLESLRDPRLKILIWMALLKITQSILSTYEFVDQGFVVFFDEFHKALGSLNDGSYEMEKITGLFAAYIQTQSRQARKFNVINIFSSQNLTDFIGGRLGQVLKDSITFGYSADPSLDKFDQYFSDIKYQNGINESGEIEKTITDDYKKLMKNLERLNALKKPGSNTRAKGTFVSWFKDGDRLKTRPLQVIYTQVDADFTGVKSGERWEESDDSIINVDDMPKYWHFEYQDESMSNLYILAKLKLNKQQQHTSPESFGFYDYDNRIQALKRKYGKEYNPRFDV